MPNEIYLGNLYFSNGNQKLLKTTVYFFNNHFLIFSSDGIFNTIYIPQVKT